MAVIRYDRRVGPSPVPAEDSDAPMVVRLVPEACSRNHELFMVGAGYYRRILAASTEFAAV